MGSSGSKGSKADEAPAPKEVKRSYLSPEGFITEETFCGLVANTSRPSQYYSRTDAAGILMTCARVFTGVARDADVESAVSTTGTQFPHRASFCKTPNNLSRV